jgi:hypothetical protein
METTNSNTVLQKKSKWPKRIFIAILTIIVLCVAYVFICGLTYSSGTRTGIVIKVSQKGYVFKTYEGELNLGGFSQGEGTIMVRNIWAFSIPRNDTAIYNTITRSEGKQMRLHYKEVIRHFFWQSETPYFIDKAEAVN